MFLLSSWPKNYKNIWSFFNYHKIILTVNIFKVSNLDTRIIIEWCSADLVCIRLRIQSPTLQRSNPQHYRRKHQNAKFFQFLIKLEKLYRGQSNCWIFFHWKVYENKALNASESEKHTFKSFSTVKWAYFFVSIFLSVSRCQHPCCRIWVRWPVKGYQ